MTYILELKKIKMNLREKMRNKSIGSALESLNEFSEGVMALIGETGRGISSNK